MAKLVTAPFKFDLDVIRSESPITAAIFENHSELTAQLEDQFFYPTNFQDNMPFYSLKESEAELICKASETVYGALVDSLELLFHKYPEKISEFYGSEFLAEHPQFIEYAKYTYDNNHEAVYGRFDIAYDWNHEKVLGFYEFNGDTPVMLFESVIMQNWMAKQINHPEDQSNWWQENIKEYSQRVLPPYKKNRIAFLADFSAVEDALTTELMRWTFDDYAECFLHDINDFEYDFTFKDKPFHVDGQQFDFVYILMPWEEMAEASPDIIRDWKKWGDSVRFLEPSWRWFVSNKGGYAWLWWLLNHSDEHEFIEEHKGALRYMLKTQLTPDGMTDYVRKPLMGRLSSNIAIYKDNEIVYETEGGYNDCPVVYQEFCEPAKLEGRGRAIVGVWMAPHGKEKLYMEGSTICIREFDNDVTDIGNERFVPHIIE